jgi:hypothetical protein
MALVIKYNHVAYPATPDGGAMKRVALAIAPQWSSPLQQAMLMVVTDVVGQTASHLRRQREEGDGPDMDLTTSSETVILAVRVLVRQRVLHHSQVRFEHHTWPGAPQPASLAEAGEYRWSHEPTIAHITINEDARLSDYPKGFCDRTDHYLEWLF